MPEQVMVTINGKECQVTSATTVAAAVLGAGIETFRRSVTGQPRGPLCGMGICFECRITIDRKLHQRSCQIMCRDGMEIETDAIE